MCLVHVQMCYLPTWLCKVLTVCGPVWLSWGLQVGVLPAKKRSSWKKTSFNSKAVEGWNCLKSLKNVSFRKIERKLFSYFKKLVSKYEMLKCLLIDMALQSKPINQHQSEDFLPSTYLIWQCSSPDSGLFECTALIQDPHCIAKRKEKNRTVSPDSGPTLQSGTTHRSRGTHRFFFWLLAPTGALVVMMVYYIYIRGNFFRFSLSPLMQLMLQVSL